MFRNFRYYLKSAASSFVRNGIMTIASFITVSCCLFLLGIFILFVMNVNHISDQIEQQCELRAYLNVDIDESTQNEVYNEILSLKNVSEARLETKEQAFENYKARLGEKSHVLDKLEGKDFLRSSIIITLDSIRGSEETVKELAKIENVEEVVNRQDLIKKVVKFTDFIEHSSIVAMLILLIVAVFIIQNTIKLSVYAREKEIHIMKFVGATDRFIRMPFVYEGIMIGLLGFLVSFVLIAFGYNAVAENLEGLINMFEFLPIGACIRKLAIVMASFGIVMGAIGSAASIKKHLKV